MARTTKTASLASVTPGRRQLISLAVVLLLLYAVLPQIHRFKDSLSVVEHSQVSWIIFGLVCSLATSLIACTIYVVLAKKRLRFGRTLAVQFASLFVNRILPAGIGAIGLNFEYLRKQRHSRASAGAVVAVNNLLGLVGHLILLGILLLTTSASLAVLTRPHISDGDYWLGVLIITAVIIVLFWFRSFRDKLLRSILGILKNIRSYRAHPLRILLSVLLLSLI